MRITRIAATGLLSFGEAIEGRNGPAFTIATGDTTVIIGPNGSGKSNVAALVHLVAAVVSAERHRVGTVRRAGSGGATALDQAGVQLRHRGFPDGEVAEARLGLELTTPVERQLVMAFLRAALVSQLTTNNPNRSSEAYWPLVDELPDRVFDPFFRGELVVYHSGVTGTHWRARFEPSDTFDGSKLVWDLSMNAGQLVEAAAVQSSQQKDLWVKMGLPSPQGWTGTGDQLQESFDPTKFSVAVLVQGPGDSFSTVVGLPGLLPEQMSPAVRRFFTLASVSVPFGAQFSVGAAYVWDRLLQRGLHIVDTDAPLGLRGEAGLLASSWRYGAEELAQPAGLTSRDLPRRLWELHNGGPEGSESLERVCALFGRIAPGRQLYVAGKLIVDAAGPSPKLLG
jgi:energy-coupling factor transporter ATP-binding protein EcfA2